jgi:hypothetical protein
MARALDLGFTSDGDDAAWPVDSGWPYPDRDELDGDLHDPADLDADGDDELLSMLTLGPHLLDGLSEREQAVLTGRFGLDGRPPRTMRELQAELGMPRAELRPLLGDAIAKVRHHLA